MGKERLGGVLLELNVVSARGRKRHSYRETSSNFSAVLKTHFCRILYNHFSALLSMITTFLWVKSLFLHCLANMCDLCVIFKRLIAETTRGHCRCVCQYLLQTLTQKKKFHSVYDGLTELFQSITEEEFNSIWSDLSWKSWLVSVFMVVEIILCCSNKLESSYASQSYKSVHNFGFVCA